jgi:hypothetical protein
MISISGVFAVTFSVVFAYVADVTDESERKEKDDEPNVEHQVLSGKIQISSGKFTLLHAQTHFKYFILKCKLFLNKTI